MACALEKEEKSCFEIGHWIRIDCEEGDSTRFTYQIGSEKAGLSLVACRVRGLAMNVHASKAR